MKKVILAAVIGSIFSGAVLADTTYQIEHGTDKETSAKFHGEYFESSVGTLGGGIELVGSDNLKHHKETTFSLDYKFNVSDALYIQPSFDYTVPSGHSSDAALPGIDYKLGNTAKFGIKSGYEFDNGLYTSARYRYEMRKGDGKSEEGNHVYSLTDKEKQHRFDLTMGYVISDVVDLSANYIYKTGSLDVNTGDYHKVDKTSDTKSADIDFRNNELELKAMYTGFANFNPYVQYTVKGSTKLDGKIDSEAGRVKASNDNVWEIGAQFRF